MVLPFQGDEDEFAQRPLIACAALITPLDGHGPVRCARGPVIFVRVHYASGQGLQIRAKKPLTSSDTCSRIPPTLVVGGVGLLV